jgi:hypothetical protein
VFEIDYAPNRLPLGRPEVQQTLPILAGDGVLGGSEIKEKFAVFEEAGVRSSGKKLLKLAKPGGQCPLSNCVILKLRNAISKLSN